MLAITRLGSLGQTAATQLIDLRNALTTLRSMKARLREIASIYGSDYVLVFATPSGVWLDATARQVAPRETPVWYKAWQLAQQYGKTGSAFYGSIGINPATVSNQDPAIDALIYWAEQTGVKQLTALVEQEKSAAQARAQADTSRRNWIIGGAVAAAAAGVLVIVGLSGSRKKRR